MSIIRKEQLSNPLSASYALTASYALNANTSTNIDISGLVTTSSFNAFTASINIFTSSYNTGSFTGSFSGSFYGTSSWALNALTASYSENLKISGSINSASYIDFTTNYIAGTNEPVWKEGRLFYDSGSGALSFYNWEQDVTLNIGQEQWLRARNQTGVPILNGTVVRLLGAIGDRPTVEPAQSTDQTNTFSIGNEIIGMATHDIENGTDGFITTFGLVNGLNTNAFNAGDLLWVSQSAGKFTNVAPSPPYDRTFVGIITRKNSNNGSVFLTPLTPIHFHDISSVSASVYQMGDLWMYRSGSAGQANAWINTKQLSGSYGITGNLTATSFTGSLSGTSSWAQSASQAITASRATTASFALTASYALSGGSGGSGSPGGGDTTIQFNDSATFNGTSRFTFNKNTNLVTIQKAGSQNVFPPIIESTTSSLAINGNIDVLGKIQTNEANIYTQTFPSIQTLPFDKNVEWDIGKSGSIALITLSDNATDFEINYFGDFLGYAKGTLIVRQDSTGGWSFPLPTSMGGGSVDNYVENNGGGTYNPTPDPNAYDILEFVCISKIIFWSIKYNFT